MPNCITPADSRQKARDARIQAIVDGAHVRDALGIDALYRRLPDGRHEVVFRGGRYIAATVDAAIEAAEGNAL